MRRVAITGLGIISPFGRGCAAALDALRGALRQGGRVAIVEYYKRRGAMEGDPDRALQHIRLDADGVIREVESNGFRLLSRKDQIPGSQYLAIFERK